LDSHSPIEPALPIPLVGLGLSYDVSVVLRPRAEAGALPSRPRALGHRAGSGGDR
jgi:hypothetical protein